MELGSKFLPLILSRDLNNPCLLRQKRDRGRGSITVESLMTKYGTFWTRLDLDDYVMYFDRLDDRFR